MARPPRQRGLGPQGRERIRRELSEASQLDIFGIRQKSDVRVLYESKGMSFQEDFEIFDVQKADIEGLGPGFSTRVKSHVFVPTISWDEIYKRLASESSQLYPSYVFGYMKVTWHKQSKNHTATHYTNISLERYRTFYNSNSKGRTVRDFEGSFYNV